MDFYLNQVLNAFSSMDASLLGEILDPDLTYEDVALPVFTRKLGEIFKEMRNNGDTYLEIETGNCIALSCNPDLIRTAYRFVGNETRDYLDFRFIIEPTADGKDHCIKDIFECACFRCHQRKDWYGTQVTLHFYADEKPGFKLSPDEVIYTEIALNAEKEITEDKKSFQLEEVQAWMEKYQSAYEFIQMNDTFTSDRVLRWSSFYHLFGGLKKYLDFFQRWSKSLLIDVSLRDLELPEDILIEVILDAEKILIEEGHEYLHYLLDEKEGFRINYWLKPFIGGGADTFSASWAWFKPRQEALVKKYYSLTDSEAAQYLESWEVLDTKGRIQSLSFHLDVREKAKNRGEEIPFGLWGSRK